MALLVRDLTVFDRQWGSVYTFEKAGDVFATHVHEDETTNHITIVAHGAVKLLGKHEGTVIRAKPGGTIIDWRIKEPHGFVAMTDGATIINLLKQR